MFVAGMGKNSRVGPKRKTEQKVILTRCVDGVEWSEMGKQTSSS